MKSYDSSYGLKYLATTGFNWKNETKWIVTAKV